MKREFFKLYASCISVEGAKNCTICDVDRKQIYSITKDLFLLLDYLKTNKVKEVIDRYNFDEESVFAQLEEIEKSELGFWCSNPGNFPDIEMKWESPEKINNVIIELNYKSVKLSSGIVAQLHELGCKFVEFRISNDVTLVQLDYVLKLFNDTKIRGVYFILEFVDFPKVEGISTLIKNYNRLINVVFHSVPDEVFNDEEYVDSTRRIVLNRGRISNKSCGNISSSNFSPSLNNFTEAVNHNSCLNKKISIDINGNVKNCPSLTHSYGNIKEVPIDSILNSELTQLWNIKKDNIKICSSCEFRYVCTDCRAFIENPNDVFSKPLKCGYNPTEGVWHDWKKDPIKTKTFNSIISKIEN